MLKEWRCGMREFSPFSNISAETVTSIGESELIRRIQLWTQMVGRESPYGIGDDCAVIPGGAERQLLLTTDSLTFGKHFDSSVDPQSAGAKLVKRNISDIAAMGGSPKSAVIAILCGPDTSILWLADFFKGISQSSGRFGVELIGGDVSGVGPGSFSSVLTLIGEAKHIKTRRTSDVDDHIYVTGSLGGSILQKHFAFEPRLNEGLWLAARQDVTSMMDLTDGLAKDLINLLNSACSASIAISQIPVSEDAASLAKESGLSCLEHAFCDGEDYELLFTLKSETDTQTFAADWRKAFPQVKLTRIGTVKEESHSESTLIDSQTGDPLPWNKGYEHLG